MRTFTDDERNGLVVVHELGAYECQIRLLAERSAAGATKSDLVMSIRALLLLGYREGSLFEREERLRKRV